MGLGRDNTTLAGAFSTDMNRKKAKKLRKDFLDEEVFGLTGRRIKRGRGFR